MKRSRYDSVTGKPFVDMRSLLAVKLLSLNTKPKVLSWISERKAEFVSKGISDFDKNLLDRLLRT